MKADLILHFRSVFIRLIRSIRVQKGHNTNGTRVTSDTVRAIRESFLPANNANHREWANSFRAFSRISRAKIFS